MESKWGSLVKMLIDQGNTVQAQHLTNLYYHNMNPATTASIPKALYHGSTTTDFLLQRMHAYAAAKHYLESRAGIMASEFQRSNATQQNQYHFKVINRNYLRHWIDVSIGAEKDTGNPVWRAYVYDFHNSTTWKVQYEKISHAPEAFFEKLQALVKAS